MTSTIQIQQLFAPTVLTGSAATIYTAPTPATTAVKNIRVRFTNTTAGAIAVTAYAIQSGGTAGAGNEFIPAVSVGPNAYLDTDVPMLAAGGFIQAFAASAASITMTCLNGVIFS